ncbi:MAG: YoaK family protein [Solirubrobacteraceae bacterium]
MITSLRHPLTRALLLLTFSTGLVDAASYLGLGRVFSANMTGNIVLLGFGIAGSVGLPVVAPLVSLGAFLLGAGLAGIVISRLGEHQRRLFLSALAAETALLFVATLFAALVHVRALAASGDAVVAMLALAMGIRNATVKTLAVPDLTTTVLTMTLTGLASESRIFGGSGKGTARRVAAVASMLFGALCGALLLKTSLALVLGVATVLAGLTMLGYRALADPDPDPVRSGATRPAPSEG